MDTLVQLVALIVYLVASLSGLATALAALLWSARQQHALERNRASLVDLGQREANCQLRLASLEARLKAIDESTRQGPPGGQQERLPLS